MLGIVVSRSSGMNSYAERLWNGMDLETDAAGYSQIFYAAEVRHGPSVDAYLDGRIDGLILSPSNPDDRPRRVAAANMPIVLLARCPDIPEDCGYVYADETQTVDLALSHLWSLGHRRIAHVVGPVIPADTNPYSGQPSDVAVMRRDSFTQWMRERGSYEPDYVVPANSYQNDERAKYAIRYSFERWQSMPNPPTAAFCANDALALATIEVATSLGMNLPRDFSIVGVDNHIDGWISTPRLTTVTIPAKEIGQEAVKALLRLINDAPVEECRAIIPVTDLIVRDSTRPTS